jgi:hypothetical protein
MIISVKNDYPSQFKSDVTLSIGAMSEQSRAAVSGNCSKLQCKMNQQDLPFAERSRRSARPSN